MDRTLVLQHQWISWTLLLVIVQAVIVQSVHAISRQTASGIKFPSVTAWRWIGRENLGDFCLSHMRKK